MKKQILLLASVVVSALAMAQSKPGFGVRVGVSSATLSGDAVNSLNNILDFTKGAITTSNHTGFFAGGYATVPLANNLSLEPAV
ncbi:MAG TPA: hypothetical protein VEV15_03010, partial [Flavisolibacter sp.]|nr:hypothetical protein [Flavisolibacter sp.]